MRFLQMNRDYLKGEYMESLIEKEDINWTSKKELAEICSCDVRTITNIVDDLSKENDFITLTQTNIKMYEYYIY